MSVVLLILVGFVMNIFKVILFIEGVLSFFFKFFGVVFMEIRYKLEEFMRFLRSVRYELGRVIMID